MNTTLKTLVCCGAAVAATFASPLAALAESPAAPIESTASQIVVRDAASGQLRAATAEEAQALRSHPHATLARRNSPTSTQAKIHASGARGARLTDEFMSYSVLVRQPDGRYAEICFNTREEAEAAVKTGAAAPQSASLPTE